MKTADLDFAYPENLVATEPVRPSRVMLVRGGAPQELTVEELLAAIPAGDVLVLNDTRVMKRRVFAEAREILFLATENKMTWEVLFPSRDLQVGSKMLLPLGVGMTLLKKGRPQIVGTDRALDDVYFEQVAELPLPPYIQKARGERHTRPGDEKWYQTAWAEKTGSFAAPTASLHFTDRQIAGLEERGVRVVKITLHVGLGTFLPVVADDLDQHEMHSEWAQISTATVAAIRNARAHGQKVWAMGTTVARALESSGAEAFEGTTALLIQPGYSWKVVDRLLTNFHQPKSTLLALVSSFAGTAEVKRAYAWAIEHKFRLFSYGDLSAWIP